MDNKKLIELQNIGLIDKNQKLHTFIRSDIAINIGNKNYIAKPIGQISEYQLKLINTDLYIAKNNRNIDLIKYQNSDEFREMSCFYLLYDDLLCSIIPCNDVNLLLCYTNNIICLKKTLACLNSKITTVFHINFNIKEDIKPKIDSSSTKEVIQVENKNLIPLSEIDILKSDNFQWLDIVTTNSDNIPSYLKSRIFKYNGYYDNEPSILYLKYIIEQYNNLPNKICFIKNNPIFFLYM